MKHVLVIGNGISGMACAVRCAARNMRVTLAAPFPSERSQSVMAAGGINAVLSGYETGDSVASHIEDTLKGGCWLGGERAVTGLCANGERILRDLESIGTVLVSGAKEAHMIGIRANWRLPAKMKILLKTAAHQGSPAVFMLMP